MATDWEYGGAYHRHDMTGVISLPFGSQVRVCDWTVEMPEFMRTADTLFIDPPWNAGNVRSFYTKADLVRPKIDFADFSLTLWQRIDDIAPKYLFLEMGKEYLGEYLVAAKQRYRYVTFYNSTYYRKASNKCYIIHATNDYSRRRYAELEGVDEADAIAWICQNHAYECIGDLCMGRGLVGRFAYAAKRRFVGTELNPKRLACLVDLIRKMEECRDADHVGPSHSI